MNPKHTNSMTQRNSDVDPKWRIAAFIDILGFSEKLEHAGDNIEELQEIYEILRCFYDQFNNKDENDWDDVKLFSDCAYISSKLEDPTDQISTYDHIGMILSGLAEAQGYLIVNENIFIRGGIDIGKIIKNEKDNIEVSSAYYRAYKIENNLAKYPIIRIGNKFIKQIDITECSGSQCYGVSGPNDNLFMKCTGFDGELFYILNYIQIMIDNGNDPNEILLRHKTHIIESYKTSKTFKIKEKYRWLGLYYHNKIVENNPSLLKYLISDMNLTENQ